MGRAGEWVALRVGRRVGAGSFWSARSPVGHVQEHVVRAQTDAHLLGAHRAHHGGGHLKHKLAPVRDATSVPVRARVGPVRQELVQQIPVAGMDLDAVKAGGHRALGAGGEGGNDARQLLLLQRARHRVRVRAAAAGAVGRPRRGGDSQCGRRHREGTVRLVLRQRGAADVPQLGEDDRALCVHRRGDCLPAFHLLRSVYARGARIAVALHAHGRGFRHHETAAGGALLVVGRHSRVGHRAWWSDGRPVRD